MASFDYRLNPLYAIKECSSCGNLHTKDCGCSKGSLEDKILVPIPDLSRRPLKIEKICLDCGDPVHGLYCRQCALIRKTLEEVFQDFQDTSKSSDDDTNFVNQEPFVVKQGPGVNSSQSPPQINHNCCYECGDSLDDIFCQRCTSLLHQILRFMISQKIDLFMMSTSKITLFPHSIPPGIDDINLDPEGDILFLESLLYDNSSPRPPEEFNYENPTESFSPSPIPVEDSDSLMEEIDIFLDGDDSIPPGIESDDFDSEDDDNSTSRPEFESFHVDYPDSGNSTIDVVEDIPVDVPNILPTHPALLMDFDFIPSNNDVGSDLDDSSPSGDRNKIYDPGICIEVESTRFLSTLSPVIDTLLSFSSENKDKVFNHGVLASKEKSSSSLSLRGFKASKLFHQKSPMLILGRQTHSHSIWVTSSSFLSPFDIAQVWGDRSS
ncbi:hypothetical protein Tco_0012056 [Tanacetum coccineum]